MSHEVFDQKLKQAFEHEHEAPQAALWEGIEGVLNQNKRRRFGLWLGMGILAISVLSIAQWLSPTVNSQFAQIDPVKSRPTKHIKQVRNTNVLVCDPHSTPIKTVQFLPNMNFDLPWRPNCGGTPNMSDLYPYGFDSNPMINWPHAMENNETETNYLMMSGFYKKPMTFDDAILASSYRKKAPNWMNSLMSKHHLELSFGPQSSDNQLAINKDSQAWVHHHLWENSKRMTHKGSGFSAKLNYLYKIGKKQQYGLSIGCEYGQRTEAIQLNESSFDIAARDNTGKIIQYTQILLKVIVGNDTTEYLASSNYSLAKTNKYKIISIPIELSRELALSQHSFAQISAGIGLSYISSENNTHIDMIWGDNKTASKQSLLNASLNAKLAVFTQFNNIGYIGIYAGYKDYLQPWTVNANQYRIHMKDMQVGLSFRKPL